MSIIYESIEEKLIEKISNNTISNIEDFLGYPISEIDIGDLEDKIAEVLYQMPEEEILKYARKYNILTSPEKTNVVRWIQTKLPCAGGTDIWKNLKLQK